MPPQPPKPTSSTPQRYISDSVPQVARRHTPRKKEAAAPKGTAALLRMTERSVLAERVRHVVERRVQLVADALHRANRRNGDKSGNQAILNGSRTFFILKQLQ